MSFQPPSAKQENQNRKILEELQKKQQALKQPNASASSLVNTTTIKPGLPITVKPLQINNPNAFNQMEFNHHLTTSNLQQHSNGHQREKAALQYALQNSFGNFISQDSSFGNQVIPVLPLFN